MIEPKEHVQEKERLKNLKSYSILDSLPETDYDNIASIAAEICGTPISLISLIDDKRQWFKARHGTEATETPKEHAFCAHAINDPGNVFIVQDARTDERFYDNPLVTGDPNIIFYAGVPLVGEEGLPLGTLCVIDDKPKILSQSQKRSLTALSDQVMNLLNLRKNEKLLKEALLNLEEKNQELERFAFIAAHDLKSPLVGVSGIAQMFSEAYEPLVDDDGKHMLQLLISSTDKLGSLIDGLLDYSKSEKLLTEEKSNIDPDSLKNEIAGLFTFSNNLQLDLTSSVSKLYANKTVLDQILINLVTNAIKYNDKNLIEIELGISENDTHYNFYVQDNGPGIDPKYHDRIFNIFETVTAKDKFGKAGNGIGLATVKKIVIKSGGSIKIKSEPEKGARFMFTLEK